MDASHNQWKNFEVRATNGPECIQINLYLIYRSDLTTMPFLKVSNSLF